MNEQKKIQPMTEERYQELICYTAMGGATVILDQYADHPETVERDIVRDYEDMMTEITRLRDELNNAAIWKSRAEALYEFVVGSDALTHVDIVPEVDSSEGYIGVFNRAAEVINEMVEIRKEEFRAEALAALEAAQ